MPKQPSIDPRQRILLLDRLLRLTRTDGGEWGMERDLVTNRAAIAREYQVDERALRRWETGATAQRQWFRWAVARQEGMTEDEAFNHALGQQMAVPDHDDEAGGGETPAKRAAEPSADLDEMSQEERIIYALAHGMHLADALAIADVSQDEWDEWMRLADTDEDGAEWSRGMRQAARSAEARCKLQCHRKILAGDGAGNLLKFLGQRWPKQYAPQTDTTAADDPLAEVSDEKLAAIIAAAEPEPSE